MSPGDESEPPAQPSPEPEQEPAAGAQGAPASDAAALRAEIDRAQGEVEELLVAIEELSRGAVRRVEDAVAAALRGIEAEAESRAELVRAEASEAAEAVERRVGELPATAPGDERRIGAVEERIETLEEIALDAQRQAGIAAERAAEARSGLEGEAEGARERLATTIEALERRIDARLEALEGASGQRMTGGQAIDEPSSVGQAESAPDPSGTVDVNAASFEQLRGLGLSVTQAARLIGHREARGGFRSLDELDELRGFPSSQLSELKERITLSARG